MNIIIGNRSYKLMFAMNDANVRWAFNIKKWAPTLEQMAKCTSYIQLEEKERLGRFYFKEDFKSSLVGRLLMRKFISKTTKVPFNEITFRRDERGKPFLAHPNLEYIKFNISHQGDYVVLAGSNTVEALGVDVMKMEYKGGKELSEFFRLMNRQFTSSEWLTIKQGTESEKIKMFTRNWCLKESYVKAIGTGLNLDLLTINFEIVQKNLSQNEIVNNTKLYIDGKIVDWEFHEMLLDDDHCVAVAIKGTNFEKVKFRELCINELIDEGLPILEEDMIYCSNYFKKMDKKS